MLERLTNWLRSTSQPAAPRMAPVLRDEALYPISDSSAMADIFSLPPTASGMNVTPVTAMRVSAVYACVRLLSGSVAQLPIPVYRKRRNGARSEVVDDPLYWLLNEEPNPRWQSAAMWEYLVGSMLLVGDGFAWIKRRKGGLSPEIDEIWPLNPNSVSVERRDNRLAYFWTEDGKAYGADQDDVLHFTGFGFDGLRSLSVISWGAREATGIALAADNHSGAFYSQGAAQRYVIKAPGRANQEQVDRLREQFAQRYFGADNNKPLVLWEGLDVSTISMSAVDAQLLESRKFQVEDIARAFGVPPFMIGDTEKTSSWGSGVEHMGRGYLIFTLQPHLIRFQQELNRKLFRKAGKFVEWNTDGFLRADMKARFDAYRQAMGGSAGPGWMTADEIRELENMAPLGGSSAEPYNPTTQGQPNEPQPQPA